MGSMPVQHSVLIVSNSRGLLRDCTTSPINRFAALFVREAARLLWITVKAADK